MLRSTRMGATLNTMLSHAVLEVTREAEWLVPDVNVVQWCDFWRVAEGARRLTVHLDARLSRRAMRTYLAHALKAKSVSLNGEVIELTGFGRVAHDEWGAAIGEACSACEQRWGPALRRALTSIVDRLELDLPHYIHPYGPVDPTVRGAATPGREHGADWKPVPRAPGPSAGLSILALLSQALTAFAINYEAAHGWPLAWTANLMAFDHPIPTVDVPRLIGIDARRAAGERLGVVEIVGRLAHPTPKVEALRAPHAALVAQVEAGWRSRFGEAPVDALLDALRAVDQKLAPGHADHPMVSYTGGFREISAARP
jgi:hypothetical protein